MSAHDAWLLSGEPGGAGGDRDIEDANNQAWWEEEHPNCESCGHPLCLNDCGCQYKAPGFEHDGHHFCQGQCSNEAKALACNNGEPCPDRDDGGPHEYTADLEYDITGETINCEHCGEEPPRKD